MTERTFTLFQARLLLMGLEFNIKTGMQMTAPAKIGGTPYALIKKHFGLKGSKEAVARQFRALVEMYEKEQVA
jgi:hypothetical protein